MGLKAGLSKPYAKAVAKRIRKWSLNPIKTQQKVFQDLISIGKGTHFGKTHRFESIRSYSDFKKQVPVRDYEGLKPYIDRIINGEEDVLWKGLPIYLSKTSGTTSGAKYIPITRESMHNHIDSARNALLCYIAETGNTAFVNGKMIFLQGSPKLDETGVIPVGRLSGIVANHVPAYLLKNRMPSYETNCIKDWENKVDAIVEETLSENMSLISGIPSWVQMYFDRLLEKTGKETISEIFPDFSLFVYGGVNFEPYRAIFERIIGKRIDSIELYPASEGFIAFQDLPTGNLQECNGLLLILNKGIFYEFIPADEFFNKNPTRIALEDVEIGINYAIILNTNAGLWGYNIGDTVKFVSTNPYRIIVTGRIQHFISAFGEHVITEEVDNAIRIASEKTMAEITEFHVAPQINPSDGELPYHEWFIEFWKKPESIDNFRDTIDRALQKKNIYYHDLIAGKVLQPLKITCIRKNGFIQFMKSQGKLGGQNKMPRLANERKVANELSKFVE